MQRLKLQMIAIGIGLQICSGETAVEAQIVPDTTLGAEASIVRTSLDNPVIHQIRGGALRGDTLFHSFDTFSLPTAEVAQFSQGADIQRIISRVTGPSQSFIDGTLQVDSSADLVLINPNGLYFGPNARLNVAGSFFASTATGIQFADGFEFDTETLQALPLTVSNPVGLQFGSGSRLIQVDQSVLAVNMGQTLALIGGPIQIQGDRLTGDQDVAGTVAGGQIELGSVGPDQYVSWDYGEHSFSYQTIKIFEPIALDQDAIVQAFENMHVIGHTITVNSGSQFVLAQPPPPELQPPSDPPVPFDPGPTTQPAPVPTPILNPLPTDPPLPVPTTQPAAVPSLPPNPNPTNQLPPLPNPTSQPAPVPTPASDTIPTPRIIPTNQPPPIQQPGLSLRPSLTSAVDPNSSQAIPNSQHQLEIEAQNLILEGGIGSTASGIYSQLGPKNTGQGGAIRIKAEHIRIQKGAQISSSTFGVGDAGSIVIQGQTLAINGTFLTSQGQFFGGIFSNVQPDAIGQGGDLRIEVDQLIMFEEAVISVSSRNDEATSTAGNLLIQARSIQLDEGASLIGETESGRGNIAIDSEQLLLNQQSRITTNAEGIAVGGNIEITTDTLVAIGNSDITANAEAAQGGQIKIQAQGIVGSTFREGLTPDSDITATSDLGPEFSGTVEIETPALDFSDSVLLPDDIIRLDDLVVNVCQLNPQVSSFLITGRHTTAAIPLSMPSYLWQDLGPRSEPATTSDNSDRPLDSAALYIPCPST